MTTTVILTQPAQQKAANIWRSQKWLLGFILVGAILLAYLPAWNAGFIWDDDVYVTGNSLLSAPDGLRRIWFSFDSPSQYFPMVYTTFRIEHLLWGDKAAGYHGFNILLHAINALLVWRLLWRLKVPGAWLAAAVFALHPVNVESVAWITELKNVQSLCFCLLALLCWVRFLEPAEQGRFKREVWYGLALAAFSLALLSKTTACTLPAGLLLICWLKRIPLNWRRWMLVVPFVVLGLIMGLVTVWWEKHHQGTQGSDFALGLVERLLIASRAMWFYAGKLLWPAGLTFSYPRWVIDRTDLLAYGWLIATVGLGGLIGYARRFVGRGAEVAIAYYAMTLAPMLGFVMLYTFHFSFVADHYQYAAMLGPATLAAAGLTTVLGKLSHHGATHQPSGPVRAVPGVALAGILLVALGVLTWRQCGMYSDIETLWRVTLSRNPQSYIAHNSLSLILLQQGQVDEAIAHARKALELQSDRPNQALALINLGNALLEKGRTDEAILHFQNAVNIQPDMADARNNLGSALLRNGQTDLAIAQFRSALSIQPRHASAHYNLGNALFDQGRLNEASEQYRAALAIQPNDADTLLNLGAALTLNNQLDAAAGCFQEILRIHPGTTQAVQAGNNLRSIESHRTNTPIRDPSPTNSPVISGKIPGTGMTRL